MYVLDPLPVNEVILCSFVTFLATQGLKVQTIKCYLSGVRSLQIASGFPDPQIGSNLPRLENIIKGIKRSQAEAGMSSRPRLPITPDIMSVIRSGLPSSADGNMIWAACCIGFFGFLRAGEFTTPSVEAYDASVHLSLSDVALDSHSTPSLIRLRVKASKTDPFRKGVDIFLGRTSSSLCPVKAMIAYLPTRGPTPGPLFVFQNGTVLSRSRLVSAIRTCLSAAGMEEGAYCGHSFRIGAATTAAKKGVEASTIQVLGRWQSSAYLRYVRIPRERLAAISSLLVS